jgi:hypothetical protein
MSQELITCVGLVDPKGLVSLYRMVTKSVRSVMLRRAQELKGCCYFQVELSDSECDIVNHLEKDKNSKGAFMACLQLGKNLQYVRTSEAEWLKLVEQFKAVSK